MELLQDFTRLPIKEELAGYEKTKDFKNYCIRIHGFKNNAYSVGLREMGDLAYRLEQLTKEAFSSEVGEVEKQLLEQYEEFCQVYHSVVDNKKETKELW